MGGYAWLQAGDGVEDNVQFGAISGCVEVLLKALKVIPAATVAVGDCARIVKSCWSAKVFNVARSKISLNLTTCSSSVF